MGYQAHKKLSVAQLCTSKLKQHALFLPVKGRKCTVLYFFTLVKALMVTGGPMVVIMMQSDTARFTTNMFEGVLLRKDKQIGDGE
jgi:hypothetical protein